MIGYRGPERHCVYVPPEFSPKKEIKGKKPWDTPEARLSLRGWYRPEPRRQLVYLGVTPLGGKIPEGYLKDDPLDLEQLIAGSPIGKPGTSIFSPDSMGGTLFYWQTESIVPKEIKDQYPLVSLIDFPKLLVRDCDDLLKEILIRPSIFYGNGPVIISRNQGLGKWVEEITRVLASKYWEKKYDTDKIYDILVQSWGFIDTLVSFYGVRPSGVKPSRPVISLKGLDCFRDIINDWVLYGDWCSSPEKLMRVLDPTLRIIIQAFLNTTSKEEWGDKRFIPVRHSAIFSAYLGLLGCESVEH